jgi:hypothetical protein
MDWTTFWAIFPQAHLVALLAVTRKSCDSFFLSFFLSLAHFSGFEESAKFWMTDCHESRMHGNLV